MNYIFYIMGKSATGKDTIYNKLLEKFNDKLFSVVLYTTRPIRSNETNHKDYNFVSINDLEKFRLENNIIEERVYHTVHGDWYYFLPKTNEIELDKRNYLMIGTLESYNKMCEYYGKDKLIPIYIEVDDGVRLDRALKREHEQSNPKYIEMCRRFIADDNDFSEQKLKGAGINKKFTNDNLDKTLSEIEAYIYSKLTK